MATVSKWTPFDVALDITATAGTVTRKSDTQYTVVINASWETYYNGAKTNYGMIASSGGGSATINKFGTKASSGSGSFTGTYSISGNGSATKTVTVTFKNFNDDNGKSATKTVSFTVTVPAWTSYVIKYNANGGSGAPSSQTKWKDQTLTLSSTKPTRTGYSFLGWSTSSSATSATYSAGGSYTANAAATLYAVWKANTYTVKFDANGGTGAPGNQTKTYGKILTLSSTKPTRTNYNFKGWGTSASATTVTYAAGASYTANAGITLYAVWELAYVKPRITAVSVVRCDSAGTAADEGRNGLVSFKWACDKSVSSIKIEWKLTSATTWSSTTVSASGTSGTVSQVVGADALSVENTYDVRITVSDGGGSSYAISSLTSMKFVIDALAGGKGLAFGKTAELEGVADYLFELLFRKNVTFLNNTCIHGTKPDGTVHEVINLQNMNGNLVLGYDNYDNKDGLTNIYGYDLNFGVSNIANPGTYRPYRRRGDTLTLTFRTSGYVTNSGKDISFWIPTSVPIIGTPTVTVSSINGFILRQGNKYTHGSDASTYVTPSSYEATATTFNGIYVKAVFADITNVVNNDAIGIYWNGSITLS